MSNWRPRDAAALTHAFLASLPTGAIWPRHPGATLARTVRGLMGLPARFLDRAATFLLVEAYPPLAAYLLPDWERVLGLPEPCVPAALTVAERRAAVREKLRRRPGGQSRPYFIGLAERLGYSDVPPSPTQLPLQLPGQLGQARRVTITEYRPFMAGVSRCGTARWAVGPPRMRFYWTVRVPDARLTWFRCGAGGGRAGQDPHVRIRRAEDLECVFRKLQPAHGQVIFNYQGVS